MNMQFVNTADLFILGIMKKTKCQAIEGLALKFVLFKKNLNNQTRILNNLFHIVIKNKL